MKLNQRILRALAVFAKDRGIHIVESKNLVEATDSHVLLQYVAKAPGTAGLPKEVVLGHQDALDAAKRVRKQDGEVKILPGKDGDLVLDTPDVKAVTRPIDQPFPTTEFLYKNLAPTRLSVCFGLPLLKMLVQSAEALANGQYQRERTRIVFEIHGDGEAAVIDIKSPDYQLHGLAMPMRDAD